MSVLPSQAAAANGDASPGSEPMAVLASRTHDLPLAEIAAIVERAYGIHGEATPLHGERDQNALILADDGARYVFRLFNAAQDSEAAALQARALLHLARVAPGLSVPRIVATTAGRAQLSWPSEVGGNRIGRLETFLPGTSMAAVPGSPTQASALGRLAAELDGALRSLAEPATIRPLLWDLGQAAHVADLVPCIDVPEERRLAATVIETFRQEVLPRLPGLRSQLIHNDLNPSNILADPQRPDVPLGIIDFGDLVWSALVNEIAIAAAYLIGGEDPLDSVCRLVAAYHEVTPLAPTELALLPTLIATRLAMTSAIAAWRAKRFPENEAYVLRNRSKAVAGLDLLSTIGPGRLAAQLRSACGLV